MEDNKQSYGIAAALSEALEAAVFADSSAAYKAYDMIEKYAYGQDLSVEGETEELDENGSMVKKTVTTTVGTTELAMASFTMYGSDGTPHTVSIPKITMMPLPLLHVTEATFDIEMTANIETSKTSESASMNPEAANEPTVRRPTSSDISADSPSGTPIRGGRRVRGRNEGGTNAAQEGSRPATPGGSAALTRVRELRRLDGRAVKVYRPSTAEREAELRRRATSGLSSTVASVTNQQMVVGNKDTSKESNSSTINMKVKIDMKQAELPDGIKLLLQAAANSLQVAANEIKEASESK